MLTELVWLVWGADGLHVLVGYQLPLDSSIVSCSKTLRG